MLLGKPHRPFIRLGAGATEEALPLFSHGGTYRHNPRELLGKLSDHRHVINVGTAMHELVHLFAGGGKDPRMVVPRIDDRDAGEAIEIRFAVNVRERAPFRRRDDDWL